MKKTGLFKIIMFVLLGIMVVTWVVSASYFTSGELSDLGMYRIGFFDFFQLLFGSYQFSYFIQILIFLVCVGTFYGVLCKTGKYRAWIEKIASKFKGKEYLFLVIVAFLIAAISSTLDYGLILFIFLPLIISIILAMGYDKITACVTTFGSMLVGTIGNTIAYNITGIINEQLSIDSLSTGIYFKIGMFVLSLCALVLYLYKNAKIAHKSAAKSKELESDSETLFEGEKISNKYPVWPIIVVFCVIFVLMILGCTKWESSFGITFFKDLDTTIREFAIKDFTIFDYIIGTLSAFGEWSYAEMGVICLLASLLIGRIYRMKFKEILEYMADGAKKMLAPGMLIVLAYTVIYFAGNTMFYPTIANFILNATSKFNLFFSSVVTILGSFLHVDMLYIANYVIPQLAAQSVNAKVLAIMIQGLYGVTMFVAPTSAVLILGLSYLGIPYKEWIKKTWKLIVALLIVVLLAMILVSII